MKIIAGSLGGRPITQPKTRSVRPMSEKVRAALFDVLGSVENGAVLDVYAGSGAVGFEAVSRGAVLVESIESSPQVAKVIVQNAKDLGLDWGYLTHRMTAETWLASPSQNPPEPRYDLIAADPPYAHMDPTVIERFALFLNPGGVLVLSHGSKHASPVLKSLELVSAKIYGDTALSFYKIQT